MCVLCIAHTIVANGWSQLFMQGLLVLLISALFFAASVTIGFIIMGDHRE